MCKNLLKLSLSLTVLMTVPSFAVVVIAPTNLNVSRQLIITNGIGPYTQFTDTCINKSKFCQAQLTCPAGSVIKSGYAMYTVMSSSGEHGFCYSNVTACQPGSTHCSVPSIGAMKNYCQHAPAYGHQVSIVSAVCDPNIVAKPS